MQRKTVSQLIEEFPAVICTDRQPKAPTDGAECTHRNNYPNRSTPPLGLQGSCREATACCWDAWSIIIAAHDVLEHFYV